MGAIRRKGVRTAKRLPVDGTNPELGANAVARLNNGDVDGYITALYHPHSRFHIISVKAAAACPCLPERHDDALT